jgi:hypothetical protein
MMLMRYWSSEYCDWRVALVTEVGEEVCTALLIFLLYFYAFYGLLYGRFFVLCLLLAQSVLLLLGPSSSFFFLLFFHMLLRIFALLSGLQTSQLYIRRPLTTWADQTFLTLSR